MGMPTITPRQSIGLVFARFLSAESTKVTFISVEQKGIIFHPITKGKTESRCQKLRLAAINCKYLNIDHILQSGVINRTMDLSENITCNPNNLLKAFNKAVSASPQKAETKAFALKELDEIFRAQTELHNRTWKIAPMNSFIISERGHIRKIKGNTPYDRMIIHSYIDNSLQPLLEKYLIYDNYSSRIDKGTRLARKRFAQFMHQAFRQYGNNQFYVQLVDFSKFYDNIQHQKLYDQIMAKIPHESFHSYMLSTILDSFKVDVSHMTDAQYQNCLNEKYIALDHIWDKQLGEKYMRKSLNIGNQASQSFSIFYPTPIDNYCKIVKGIKFYGRYMDDIFIISDNKQFLHETVAEITKIASELGLFINEKKTQIYKADRNFKFLNRIYRMSDTGHLFEYLSQETITRQRRKMKKFKLLLESGKKDYSSIQNQYRAWIQNNYKFMSKKQLESFSQLYNDLFLNGWMKQQFQMRR